ncbi:MAG: ABC-type spermidine/putrescine transport system permease component I [Bacillota bacterium]|nr:MAG: ABC-type spermidine/putrescine transport system permease component I [Bacillota bacterium]MBS3950270.1 ABC transporter permease subunit [Peptococcaceae bacterium]
MYRRFKPYILVAPLLVFLGATFYFGLGNGLLQSFGAVPGALESRLTLRYYREVLGETSFFISLLYTVYVALVATVVSNLLGIVGAFAMLGLKRESKWPKFFYQLPLVVPHLVVVILVFHLFSQTGLFSRLAWRLRLVAEANDFPLLVFDPGAVGVILVYLYKQIPFVSMIVFGTLGSISKSFAEVAYNLGASRAMLISQVFLPLLRPTILSVFLMTFTFSFGAFEVPFLLGSPAWNMLPVKAYVYYTNVDLTYRAQAMVVNVMITVISIGLVVAYSHAAHLRQRMGNGGDI